MHLFDLFQEQKNTVMKKNLQNLRKRGQEKNQQFHQLAKMILQSRPD